MKLKNKIAIIISSAVILSAAAAGAIYRAALKDALLSSHFLMEKRNLEMVATSLTSIIDSLKEEEETMAQPRKKFNKKFVATKKTAAEKIRQAATTEFGIVFDAQNIPHIIITGTGDKAVKKINFISVWRQIKITPINRGERTYFATDNKGFLVAHEDEERVKAKSDFSSLESVSTSIKSDKPSGIMATSDEKGSKTIAVWLRFPLPTKNTLRDHPKKEDTSLILFSFAPYESVMFPSKQIAKRTTVLVLVIAAFLVGLGIIAADKISRPLTRLARAAKEVGEGNLDFPLEKTPGGGEDKLTSDEVGKLYSEFARMTESLKNLLKMRDDLVHMIIHDLKSPLSAVISSVEFIAGDKENPPTEKQKKFLTIARNSSSNLMRLIEDMLDAAKIEEGKMTLNITRNTDIKQLLYEIEKNFEAQKIQEGKILTLCVPRENIVADIDESLIKRTLINIVSNAFRHTKSGEGVIEIKAEIITNPDRQNTEHKEYLRITISDNGEGIAKEYQDKIFDKFTRGKTSALGADGKIARSGTGLGLTFSKMAVEAHAGGRIFVESEVGRGAAFTILLPREQKTQEDTNEG